MGILPLAAQFAGQTLQVEMDPGEEATVPEWEFTGTGTCTYNPTADLTVGAYFGDDSGFQPLTLNGDATFQLDHKYVAPGPYTVAVTALDLQGSLGSATGQLGPAVSISDAAPVTEGLTQQFTVTLSQAASFPVNVEFATQDGTGSRAQTIRSWTPRAGRSRSRRARR